ncbi:MAG: hypothetical protein GYA71_07330 [Bacteroidales bacterium]|nr:hypothetical protein [Bacteroidales bacterium]
MTWVIILVFLIVSYLIYILIIRPKHLRWGASTAEVNLNLPGDDMVDKPDFNATIRNPHHRIRRAKDFYLTFSGLDLLMVLLTD